MSRLRELHRHLCKRQQRSDCRSCPWYRPWHPLYGSLSAIPAEIFFRYVRRTLLLLYPGPEVDWKPDSCEFPAQSLMSSLRRLYHGKHRCKSPKPLGTREELGNSPVGQGILPKV